VPYNCGTQEGIKAVSQTCHLNRRNGVWHYRRRVPVALAKSLGKTFVQFSHGTASLKEAKKRRALEVGTPIVAYQKGSGYVGYGTVTAPSVMVRDFVAAQGPLLDQTLTEPALAHDRDDPESAGVCRAGQFQLSSSRRSGVVPRAAAKRASTVIVMFRFWRST
jgi:hypothetical protein